MAFTPVPPELLELMTPAELAEYEDILRLELAMTAADGDEPELTGDIDLDDLPATPGALAAALTEGKEQQRPHLDLLDQLIVQAVDEGGVRAIVNVGPRYGKSRRIARWGTAWALINDPDLPVMLISHTADLVEDHSRWIRDLFEQYDLGLRPRKDSRAVNRWHLDGYEGGLLVAGVGGSVTGRGAKLLIIDDLIKDAEQADSPTWRRKIWKYYTETLFDRLEPDASVIVVETRWHPEDLTGRLLAEQPEVWTHIRIPTVAEKADPIGRRPGELLWPERFDEKAVAEQQSTLGSAAFSARHQQKPDRTSGGIWEEGWIEANRVLIGNLPPLVASVTVVDPSGSDKSTAAECGIVALALGLDGDVYVLDDRSKRTTPAQWGAIGVQTAFAHQCGRILVEDNYGGQQTEFVIRTALRDHVRGQARILHGPRGPEVERVNAQGSKLARAKPVAALYEAGRVHHVDDGSGDNPLEQLEDQLVTWKGEDKPSPDRLDALVHGVRALLMPAQTKTRHVQTGERWAGARRR